jgi:hypothetical protein
MSEAKMGDEPTQPRSGRHVRDEGHFPDSRRNHDVPVYRGTRGPAPVATEDTARAIGGLKTKPGGSDQPPKPILSSVEKVAQYLRDDVGEDAQIADLGSSSAGINLNLSDDDRRDLLEELVPAIKSLGFK